jgi:stress-induced morphogen
LDTIGSAVGTLYKPRHIRKIADAKAYEIEKISEAVRHNSDAIITYESGAVEITSPEFEDLVKRAQHQFTYQELRNQENIESVIDLAYAELENEEDVTDEPVDEDWISRFFGIIKDVSNEQMQYVWGKIHAGEIKRTGSLSLRTMDVIKSLSQLAAVTFQKITPLVIHHYDALYIAGDYEILSKYGISHEDKLRLAECGVLIDNGILSTGFHLAQNEERYFYTDNLLLRVVGKHNPHSKAVMNIHILTRAGAEIYKILAHSPNDEYMMDFAENLYESSHNNIEAYIHKAIVSGQQYEDDPIKAWK